MANNTEQIREFWEREVCGTREDFIGEVEEFSPEYFRRIETYRYQEIPYIHDAAQFTTQGRARTTCSGPGPAVNAPAWT